MWSSIRKIPVHIVVLMILCYKSLIRPFLIGSCKFYPTCSDYAVEAVQSHGLIRGIMLGTARVCRCHPFSAGGIDPVPTQFED